jgi:hypothetical protein
MRLETRLRLKPSCCCCCYCCCCHHFDVLRWWRGRPLPDGGHSLFWCLILGYYLVKVKKNIPMRLKTQTCLEPYVLSPTAAAATAPVAAIFDVLRWWRHWRGHSSSGGGHSSSWSSYFRISLILSHYLVKVKKQ